MTKEAPAQIEINWWLLILGIVGFIVAVILMIILI